MCACSAWSMISVGTSCWCASVHSKLSTLCAITPSLSSSASRLINSSSFSRCLVFALDQLSCKPQNKSDEKRVVIDYLNFYVLLYQPLLQKHAFTKGKGNIIKEGHTSPGRSLGTTNDTQLTQGCTQKT